MDDNDTNGDAVCRTRTEKVVHSLAMTVSHSLADVALSEVFVDPVKIDRKLLPSCSPTMSKSPVDVIADQTSDLVPSEQKRAEMMADIQPPGEPSLAEVEKDRKAHETIMRYRKNLADNMQRFRARKKWNQTSLARAVGCSQSQIALLEREDQNVGLGILTKMALAFNVEPMVLLSPPSEIDRYFIMPSDSSQDKNPTYLTQEDALLELQKLAGAHQSKTVDIPASLDNTPLGSPSDPLTLAVVARIVGAAYKRIEVLRHKHGSVPMTRAMLNGVLAAILNASHDADDECGLKDLAQPQVVSR